MNGRQGPCQTFQESKLQAMHRNSKILLKPRFNIRPNKQDRNYNRIHSGTNRKVCMTTFNFKHLAK